MKREMIYSTEGRGKLMQVDNRKVMGEALKEIRRRLIAPYLTEDQFWQFSRDKPLVEIIDSALAKKPRNCDVGTAEEQKQRYDEWRNHDGLRAVFGLDKLDWAQMPYGVGL